MSNDELTIAPLRLDGDWDGPAMGYDGQMIAVGALVQRRTGGVVWRVDAMTDDDGRARLHVTATDGTIRTTFHADFAVLAR